MVSITDCSEIFIEQPKNVTACAQTWSNYKYNNTAKYLIELHHLEQLFLSAGWGGSVSDKQINIDSVFLEKISMGNCILADRGFIFKKDLAAVGVTLKIPHFTKGKINCKEKK